VTLTEKSFRPSDRAARLGVIVCDASYVGTAELRGRQCVLVAVLARVLDCARPGAGAARCALPPLTPSAAS
jgi:hypothetical protein